MQYHIEVYQLIGRTNYNFISWKYEYVLQAPHFIHARVQFVLIFGGQSYIDQFVAVTVHVHVPCTIFQIVCGTFWQYPNNSANQCLDMWRHLHNAYNAFIFYCYGGTY